MPVHELAGAGPLPAFGVVLAYGPAPGVELIPYFLGLLAWAGVALSAVLLAPIAALIRRIRGPRAAVPPEAPTAPERLAATEASQEAGPGQA